MTNKIPGLVITGTIGSGKTALAAEIGDLLSDRGRAAAVVDLDWLGWLPAPSRLEVDYEGLILTNLTAIWPNFQDAGAEALVVARVVQSAAHLQAIYRALPDVAFTVVLVTASVETVAARLRKRDSGAELEEHLAETLRFDELVRRAGVEDFVVSNEDRLLREVAEEVLLRAGWPV